MSLNYYKPLVHESYTMPSFQTGAFYAYKGGDRLSLGAEILFMQINGQQYMVLDISQPGSGTQTMSDNFVSRINYLAFPVYCAYGLNKISFNLGAQANFVLSSTGKENGQTIMNGVATNWQKKPSKLGIDNYSVGVKTGMVYYLNRRIAVDINYYYGFNNILESAALSKYLTWKIQQISIGLRVSLKKKV